MAEFDSTSAVFKGGAKNLAALLEAGAERARLWQPAELAAIFRHQLSAPIRVDLSALDDSAARKLKVLTEAQGLLLTSFADLFRHTTPPLELLEMTKDFAKANLDQTQSSLPSEIASALYYTSIAAALARLDRRITQLPDAELQRGLQWTADQTWLDVDIRKIIEAALQKISSDLKKPGGAP